MFIKVKSVISGVSCLAMKSNRWQSWEVDMFEYVVFFHSMLAK